MTVVLALALFLASMGMVLLVNHPVPIPGLPLKQNQDAETLLYLGAFAVILPLALVAGSNLADRIADGPNLSGLTTLTGLLAVALALAIIGVKVSSRLPWGDGVAVAFGAAGIWWAAAALVIWRAAQPRAWKALLSLSAAATALWTAAGALALIILLCLTDLSSISPLVFGVGVAFVAGILAISGRFRLPSLARPWGIGIDVLLVILVLLLVPDLVVVRPEQAPGNLAISLDTSIIQFHQNFLLGPANEVLAGRTMLVDTASQYGVAIIYLLAGWFELAPIGYGTLSFLSGALSALAFASGYCILRIAGTSRLIACGALAAGVIALVFNTSFPIDSIPQDSTLRFGLPLVALLPLVTAERWPRYRYLAWGAALTATGISSIWSFEAFAYMLATLAGIACLKAYLQPPKLRLQWLVRRGLWVAGACACTHILLAGATLAGAGQLPDWGQYLAYLHAFLFGHLGDLNYDFARWSPGLAVGAGYLASAAAIVLLARREPYFVQAERPSLVALAGATAYGIAIYSYFDNRSTDFTLTGVALPALLVGTLWLGLLLRSPTVVCTGLRRGALGIALGTAVLLVSVGWSSIGGRYPHSALAYSLPGGESLRGALYRLWHMPPFNAMAPEGQRLLSRFLPGERRSLVLATPDLAIEILLRSQRGNVLPLAAPVQDSFVVSERLPGLRRAVDGLRPGDRMLIDQLVWKALGVFKRHPSIDPLQVGSTRQSLVPTALAPLQAWAVKRIGERFELRTVHRDPSGLAVVELVARR